MKVTLTYILTQYSRLLGDNLVGIYVHGSIAFGCFNWDWGDIDFIVVVNKPLSKDVKSLLFQTLADLSDHVPPKGFEMSIVLRKFCENFVYPTPYELHFSNSCSLSDLESSTDYDLAAHFTVIKSVGIVLYGEAINKVFGDVPKKDYLDSIFRDVKNAKEDVLHSPVYIILNLCRVYAYIKEEAVISKEQGGLWGLKNLPEKYNGLISAALDDYTNGKPLIKDENLQEDFCEYMLNLIGSEYHA